MINALLLSFVLIFSAAARAAETEPNPPSPSDTFFSQSSEFSSFEQWEWSGALRAQVNFLLEQKPSSVRGQVRPDWGSLRFENELRSRLEPAKLRISGHVGPARQTPSNEPVFAWDELALSWGHSSQVSLGLLLDPVVSFAWGAFWGSDYGFDFETGLAKWQIFPRSDLAVAYVLESEYGRLGLQASNGEGWPQSELGVRKDYQIILERKAFWSTSSAGAQIFFRGGGYDQIGDSSNIKERYGLQAFYAGDFWSIGGLGVWLRDSVDAVTGKMAEGVDLSARGGQINKGFLSEIWGTLSWGEKEQGLWRGYLRAADYAVDRSSSDKKLTQGVLGVAKDLGRTGMSLSLSHQSTRFAPGFAAGLQDRSRWMLSWVWGVKKGFESNVE